MPKDFVRLANTTSLTVNSVGSYYWVEWKQTGEKKEKVIHQTWDASLKDNANVRKVYAVETASGTLEASTGQLSSKLLETLGVKEKDVADIKGAIFEVKNNGKTGMDIRYFFNFQGYTDQVFQADSQVDEEELPF